MHSPVQRNPCWLREHPGASSVLSGMTNLVHGHRRTHAGKKRQRSDPTTGDRHLDGMQRYALTITLLTATACGNPYAHCDPSSALNPGITDDQQGECDDNVCKWDPDSPACDGGTGETGDEDDVNELVLIAESEPYPMDDGKFIRAVMPDPWQVLAGMKSTLRTNCMQFSAGWKSWSFGEIYPEDSIENHICLVPGRSFYLPQRAPLDHVNLCYSANGPTYTIAEVWDDIDEPGYNPEDWPAQLVCPIGRSYGGTCARGPYDLYDGSAFYSTTCACDIDEDCQPGAVCQGGYNNDDSDFLPRAHYCVWDIGDGTSNGFLPEGPSVYGLESWSDGVEVDGNTVLIEVPVWVRMRQGALWNDDQRISEEGVVTRCGPESLCAEIGLTEGDTLTISPDVVSALDALEPAIIPVTRANGLNDQITVIVH